ncbi:transglutaminase family protein [Desulfopila aestuarii]|uniref:Transglutaminase-like enzyme, putative cysteine protease n=1 Tax=Desulfopila aestuarii DSM 18488 TaxID=1121416 RepID=A0A1M7YCK4_9BACT|nr:transglutaminase family protein [Desulfopila aestuarii]SHO50382.1 Transglutaminase-like enzyme, putative cysteine protease [Desulfopila aestuarii DSM 18488]
MKYRVTHTTTYSYSEPASLSQNELYLLPKETPWQKVSDSAVTVTPEPAYHNFYNDYFGNCVRAFMIQHPHSHLVVTAVSTVLTMPPQAPPSETTPPWETVARQLFDHHTPADLEACQFRFVSPLTMITPAVEGYARISFPSGRPILAGAIDLMQRIFTEFTYDKDATTIDTSVDQVLVDRKGVCQDFAHLAISCLRSLGLAARYVSGYLETLPPPGKQKLAGADASHAWLSIYIPNIGWVDLDPTNNIIPGEQHITLAWGRDYGDVTPVKGVVMGGGVHSMSVMVDVSRIEEDTISPGK